MGFLALVAPIAKSIFGGILKHFENKQQLKLAKQDTEMKIELAKQEMVAKQVTADITWDQIQAKNSAGSWKDEYWTIVLSIPMILCFLPFLAGYVEQGFNALMTTPDWYRYAVLTAIAAAFGRSELIKWKTNLAGGNNGG
jgi:hypothetical protein